MSITTTSITVNSQRYDVAVSDENGVKKANLAGIQSTYKDISAATLDQIQRSLIRDGVSIQMPDGELVNSEARLDALANLQKAAADLATDIISLMAIFQKFAILMRKVGREQRASELTGQIAVLNLAADKMKEAADKRLTAAIVEGAIGIVSGLIQVGGNLKQLSTGVEAYGKIGSGIGDTLNSVGKIVTASLKHEAELMDAEKAKLDAKAKEDEAGVQRANELMQSALEIIRDMQEKIQAIQQSQTESNRSIARNI